MRQRAQAALEIQRTRFGTVGEGHYASSGANGETAYGHETELRTGRLPGDGFF